MVNDFKRPLEFASGGGGDYIRIGKALGTYSDRYEGSLDDIGHEFTHGVSVFSAELTASAYNYEGGALMESFSDILVEFSVFACLVRKNDCTGVP
ncbi:hypothetical protein ES708_34997 [subsurface metagenome]